MGSILFFQTTILNYTFNLLKEDQHYIFISTDDDYQKLIKNKTLKQGSFNEFEDAINQLQQYFLGELETINLPIKFTGTLFQQQVWTVLLEIPYGKTTTYKEIAKMIHNEKSIRAVASAIGKNPLLIVVPCHRVIGSDGKLHGFRCGLKMKQKLLDLERLKGNS